MVKPKSLRILILGGTQLIGYHLADIAQRRGHIVTLFNRGRTNPQALPDTEKLVGDRDGQLDALKGRQWDAAIDVSAYIPRHVHLSAELLAPSVRRYLYVSTVSVYASFAQPNDERSPMGKLEDETVEHVDATTYGPLKGLGEKAAQSILDDRLTIVRPGYVVGPNDHTERFTYWPARAARGGEMAVPGSPSDPMQFIDVRDLTRFMVELLEQDKPGTYNAVSPPGAFNMGRVIEASIKAAQEQASPKAVPDPVWTPAGFLEQQTDIVLNKAFPLWHSPGGKMSGFAQCDTSLATRAGLKITALETTVRDTLAWHLGRSDGERENSKVGLTPERERTLLDAWKNRS